jgi:hydroxymethylpyrimidine pyrophosphatase-like HAD family hydrolase
MSEKIHAICSDIDGTLIIPGQDIPTAEVLQSAQELPVPLMLASARSYDMLSHFLDPSKGIDMLGLGSNY